MKIDMNRDGNRLEVALEGRLDTMTAPEFEEALEPLLNGLEELLIDLGKLVYISRAGLRALLAAEQTMEQQGSMKVINVQPEVMEIFEVTGFTDILDIES